MLYVIIAPALSFLVAALSITNRYRAEEYLEDRLLQVYILYIFVGQCLHFHFIVNIKITPTTDLTYSFKSQIEDMSYALFGKPL